MVSIALDVNTPGSDVQDFKGTVSIYHHLQHNQCFKNAASRPPGKRRLKPAMSLRLPATDNKSGKGN